MKTLQELLEQPPILLDGGWGTQLQERGLEMGECPDAWNLTHPDQVEAIARDYTQAGSQIILTNTFGANRITLSKHDLADRTFEINQKGAELSKKGADGSALVFGSIGPTGKMLLMDQITEDELWQVFREQAQALAAGGVDGIVVETMSDPAEAKIAVAAAKESGLPVTGCMCFDTGKNKDRTMMGTTVEKAVEELLDAGADIIGANCGQGLAGYISICEQMKKVAKKPIWIKANAGLPELENGLPVYKTTAEDFASMIPKVIEAGADFVGGCCGTTPKFIQEVKKVLAKVRTDAL